MPPNTPGTIEGGETAALEGAVINRAVVRFTQVRDPNAKHPIKPEDALTDPIMLRENAANIFVPNWQELPRMKHGTLRSAYESSMWGEGNNLYQARVYRWTRRDQMPTKARLVKTMCIFAIKWDDMTGLVDKFKARIVAKGFTQIEGVDYNETYATTPKLSTMRYFIMMAARDGLKLYEFDIKAAYLNADLEETIYAEPPPGMEKLDENGQPMVWLLLKALYGLKQSGNRWMMLLIKVLKKLGMKQSMADTSLWYRLDRSMVLFVHTDDGKVAYSDRAMLDELLAGLRAEVTMGDETEDVKRMFNIAVEDSKDGRSIKLNQRAYLENMMTDHKLESKSWRAILPENLNMDRGSEQFLGVSGEEKPRGSDEPLDRDGRRRYLSLLQTVHWVARCTR